MFRFEYEERAPRPRWRSALGLSGGFLALLAAAVVILALLAIVAWVIWFVVTAAYWLPRG